VSIAVRLFHFSLALPLLLALLWWQDLRPVAAWCSLPLLVLVQFALTAGLACPLAALNVRLRDTQHIAAVLLQLAMYLTPVFYSVDAVPAAMRRVLFLNPMVPLLEAWRDVLLRGRWPDALNLAWLVALAGVLLIAGRRLFLQQSRSFVEEL
jgi:lipopolysaccharide transport system permease protein